MLYRSSIEVSRLTRRQALRRLAAAAAAAPWAARPALGQASAPASASAERPNLLLICVDTLRASHLGRFGYPRGVSPNLDALAANGMLFRRAYSTSSWTCPAHASVFTGVYSPAHGVDNPDCALPPAMPTVAQLLQGAGYATQAIVSGPMVSRKQGFDRGFDDFDDRTYVAAAQVSGVQDPKLVEEILLYRTKSADLIRQNAERWLFDAPRPQPWFLFVHFWDAHADYKPPAPYDNLDPSYSGPIDGVIKSDYVNADMPQTDLHHFMSLYDGEIAWTDSQLGLFLKTLVDRGVTRNTCVILFSDHGEEFFDHGDKGHAHNLFEPLIHVPIMAYWPGRLAAGAEALTPVSLLDLAPTLLDLAGAPTPEWMQGRSLKPLLFGEAPALPQVPLFGALFFRQRSQLCILDYPLKLINDTAARTFEVYNVADDPAETTDLYPATHQLADSLFPRLQAWWDESSAIHARFA
ncbi:MAG: sulfatase [Candidatus Sumerlaeota bacterium]|nr:sulfatase [Candidatus Sumerlaeota bacterium]